MSEDLGKKIQQIADMLGQDSMPDNVKSLIGLLAGSMGSKDTRDEEDTEQPEVPVKEERHTKSDSDNSADMMRKITKVMDKLNTGNDPRINLLHAIKPFMNSKRQKKINNCIRLLQMTSLTRLMDDSDK